MVKELTNLVWTYYVDTDHFMELDASKVGKWMYFFRDDCDLDRIARLCREAVELGIVVESKHSNFDTLGLNPHGYGNSGVCCFYLHADDVEGHKKVIGYFLKNDMIAKTKAGRYYNISFKFDAQTNAMEYGSAYSGKIKLDQFIDLKTGDWIV